MKNIESAVKNTISNYQATSKLKLFRRLRPQNSKKITNSIIKDGNADHLMDLIKKRDYYTGKIHELLNSAGEESDPKLIASRSEAEHYICKRILKDRHKVASIRSLMEKHKRFQEGYRVEQEQIMKKNSDDSSSYTGLEKLGAMKAQLKAKKQLANDTELREMYLRAAVKQRELSLESSRTLKSLGVPFFVNESKVNDPMEDKIFVLEVLQTNIAIK